MADLGVSAGPGCRRGRASGRVGSGRAGSAHHMARPRGRGGGKCTAAALPRRACAQSRRRCRYLCGPGAAPPRQPLVSASSERAGAAATRSARGRAARWSCISGRGRRKGPRTPRESPHRAESRAPNPRGRAPSLLPGRGWQSKDPTPTQRPQPLRPLRPAGAPPPETPQSKIGAGTLSWARAHTHSHTFAAAKFRAQPLRSHPWREGRRWKAT